MSFKKVLKLGALLMVTLPLMNCAHQKGRIIVTNCVSDPPLNSDKTPDETVLFKNAMGMRCVDVLGQDVDILYKDTANWVCRPPQDDKQLMEELYKK